MLRALHLKDVGPAARFDLELGERLNVLTGDNGLGKSFILDVAWWALTGTWVGRPVLPQKGKEESAELRVAVDWHSVELRPFTGEFARGNQSWSHQHDWNQSRRDTPSGGISLVSWAEYAFPVLYVRADAGFSLWDPVRNLQRRGQDTHAAMVPRSYHFEANELWNGAVSDGKSICNGLVRDWVSWQLRSHRSKSEPFHMLERLLQLLSHPEEMMVPGEPVRLYLDDVRDFPTARLPYSIVPVIHASSGMRRIIALAYFLTWAWTEHVQASELLGRKPSDRFVVLIEEPETHLHPKWQRHILPALIDVLDELSPEMQPQILATTHSPLVLASLEPHFKPSKDKLFLFDLEEREVMLREVPWVKHGDAASWLTSDVFDLRRARSVEAERAIDAAHALMIGNHQDLPEGLRTVDEIQRELQRVLPDQDVFWPRWVVWREQAAA